MNKWMEILIGLIPVVAAVGGAIVSPESWGAATISFLKGGVICFVVLIGLLFLMLGISDLKD